ncbi:hypothetical protein fugu_018868 [Takifugu bimaculatus]|uniref:Hsp90 co-chaperone Cdc37-like 1 n=1 Tax=Takifugu bimaculatus TaxID=433685 RepID=A0A4Z2BJZ5_9TELE|nr:hypothetical protein fugu_018868 [Takifugu bimaculatus]
MAWLGNKSTVSTEDSDSKTTSTTQGFTGVYPHQKSSHPSPSPPPSSSSSLTLCQSQQHCLKASVISSWRLAEAQDQLCSLGVHSSESLEQEQARTLACPTELLSTEEEWRRKENMLGAPAGHHSPVLGSVRSWDVFDRSIINAQNQKVEIDWSKCKSSIQNHEQELKHFGMLRRWDDSQRFLADMPQLICEETANYLILWCIKLQQEGKEALMKQVAHQAVVMQFILEVASHSQQDPRGCFRQFFHKAKDGQDIYLEVFHAEVEAFIQRVKEHAAQHESTHDDSPEHHQLSIKCSLVPNNVPVTLPPAEHPMMRFIETGLWTSTGTCTQEDTTEVDDTQMMETS